MPFKINSCSVWESQNLVQVLDLGEQMLAGVFPRTRDTPATIDPIRLVKYMGDQVCGLLQLEYFFDLREMYGERYGYRFGLKQSMDGRPGWFPLHRSRSSCSSRRMRRSAAFMLGFDLRGTMCELHFVGDAW